MGQHDWLPRCGSKISITTRENVTIVICLDADTDVSLVILVHDAEETEDFFLNTMS